MHIQKVLNSSVVLVQDDSGEESILLGKGIGYGRKAGEPIERQPSDRVFLPLSNPDAQPMLEQFSSIPAVYLDLTQDIVDDAEQSLGVKLSAHIYLLLTDHLHFAVERQQKGLVVTNRIFWEIKHFYPKEYAVGQRGLQKVRAKLDIELPDEEAGNIAFHIVNARQDPQAGYDAMRAAQFISELSNIVTYSMHCPVSTESIHDGTPLMLVTFLVIVSRAIRSRLSSKSDMRAVCFLGTLTRLANGLIFSIRIALRSPTILLATL